MKVEYHPAAIVEFAEATVWYEEQRAGLGEDFRSMVARAEAAISAMPRTWPRWNVRNAGEPIRVHRVPGFPYLIPYVLVGERIVILAVAHSARRPGYWQDRAADPDKRRLHGQEID